jgi:peptidoglycan/LPS O-acetylase OafA/YrhL
LNLAAAAASAMVIVNTVVYVQSKASSVPSTDVPFALAAFGGGSMLMASWLQRSWKNVLIDQQCCAVQALWGRPICRFLSLLSGVVMNGQRSYCCGSPSAWDTR